jgi:predicted small metal-binding protein
VTACGLVTPEPVSASQGQARQTREKEENHVSTHEHSKSPRRIACGDVVPGCGFTATAETEDDLIQKVVEHAAREHGVTEITPELAAKVKAAITR